MNSNSKSLSLDTMWTVDRMPGQGTTEMNMVSKSHRHSAASEKSPNRLAGTRLVLIGLLLISSGCSRAFWRRQSERDAYEAISERMTDPRWQVPRFELTPDADSRFYDPYDPDQPPLPPDDPAAHAYMHCVDGMSGYKSWHKFGDSFSIENPHWLAKYGVTPEMMNPETGDYTGRLPKFEKLTLAQSVELSQIHSRELQTQLETLFQAALDVSLSRFDYSIKYLGLNGREAGITQTSSIFPNAGVRTFGLAPVFGVSKLLPAGGQIAADIANQTLWTFSNHKFSAASPTTLSFALTQPLLRGAGRKVQLENLTQFERTLLYQTRTLARFRQILFTNVVTDGAGNFLNLLQQIQVIRNQQQNIERLRTQVAILESNASQKSSRIRAELADMPAGLAIPEALQDKLNYDADDQMLIWIDNVMSSEEEAALLQFAKDPAIPADNGLPLAIQEIIQAIRVVPAPLDVLQLRGQLANSINQLRTQERSLQDSLDSFKLTIGLPTDTVVSIDDSALQPFAVIDDRLKVLENAVIDYLKVWSQLPDDNPLPEQLLSANRALGQLVLRVEAEGLSLLDEDAKHLDSKLESRLAGLDLQEDRDRVEQDIQRDLRLLNDAKSRLANLKQRIQELDELIQAPNAQVSEEDQAAVVPPEKAIDKDGKPVRPLDQILREDLREEILKAQQGLLQVARSLSVVEIGLRVEQIEVPKFDIPLEVVEQTAVENRLDLMNSKAAVMDARRKLEVTANALRSALGLNVVASTTSKNSQPLNFPSENFEIQGGLTFKGPLNRMTERNAYRKALVTYQQARRAYMAAEDGVKQDVRRSWRQISVQKRNLETSRLQLRLAARQYESAVDESTAPAPVGGGGTRSGGVQGTNLIQALNAIISAQNSLIQNWVTFEQNRAAIYRDMGMMEVGPDGIWNDPQYRGSLGQDTQDGLPGEQTLPDGGPDDGQPEAIPTPLDPLGLRGFDGHRDRSGWSGEAGPALFETDGESDGGLLPVQYEIGGEEAVLDLPRRAGKSRQYGERDPE